MSITKEILKNGYEPISIIGKPLPLVSIILPAYNESAILQENVVKILKYLHGLENDYEFEIIIVNDGSKDNTGALADHLVQMYSNVKVIHHLVNMNIGSALRTGFRHSLGDIVVTMDLDLSYSIDHIEKLIKALEANHSDVVIASPYMKGGKVTQVPFTRKWFSKMANWYMSRTAQEKYHTFTSIMRAYDGDFIRSLNLKAKTVEINPEIIYKAMILRARIVEVPSHLDWTAQNKLGKKRTSSIRIFGSIVSSLMSGFIFRPYVFFLNIGWGLFLVSLYFIYWIIRHTLSVYPHLASGSYFDDRFSDAIGNVFEQRPHAFFICGLVIMIAMQFIGIGFLSLQNKRYFEEMFHISTSILRKNTTRK